MDETMVARLRVAAVALAGVVAVTHLLHPSYGGPALLVYASAGYLGDPRPVAFLAGGFLMVFAASMIVADVYRRGAYVLAAAVAGTFLVGFGVWHTLLDHGAFWPGLEPRGHPDTGVVVVLLDHLVGDWLTLTSKGAEAALLVVCVVLFRAEAPRGDGPNSGSP
ncbi:hypothetical protein [Haloparvum sedimenti]|uniref:hypothetical protein n=1 Tax=Haloparvum sedimenti TaxID=1678448 RepID=UPI00071E8ABE|nr:hypothetical protein [Haloparvum sedimenti]